MSSLRSYFVLDRPRLSNLLAIMSANTIESVLAKARSDLKNISDSPDLDAELLLSNCLKKSRTYCHTWPEHKVSESELVCFKEAMALRRDDYPVAYILGTKPFWTFDVTVTPDVLIPRPETELLVEVALQKIANIKNPKILDLGTGSGAIALALASERKDAELFATDKSELALNIALGNARKLNLDRQVHLLHSDWFSNINESNFDMIVSNPPYIAENDPHLKQTIRHEPPQALIADNQGMQDIEKIIEKSIGFLKNKGWVIIEHAFDQNVQTLKLFSMNKYSHSKSKTDLNGNWRISFAQKNL